MKGRDLAFVAICIAGAGAFAGYLLLTKPGVPRAEAPLAAAPVEPAEPSTVEVPAATPAAPLGATNAEPVVATPDTPLANQPAVAVPSATGQPATASASRVFFRHTAVDQHYGQLATAEAGSTQARRFLEELTCEVVYVAADRGLCLAARRGVLTTYAAQLFEVESRNVLAAFPLNGPPSRTRVSADGRYAALTVFLTGHSYTSLDFSTQTLLIDARDGTLLADLEQDFTVTRDGQVIREEDFNFWGVTFAPDSRQFYATLSTDGRHWLIRGDVEGRTAEVIHADVECPSVSPSGEQVAFKRRQLMTDRVAWELRVVELATGRETLLTERRSVDDQLEWLDESQVLYTLPTGADDVGASTDVWVARTDAADEPRLFLRNAYSPAVLR